MIFCYVLLRFYLLLFYLILFMQFKDFEINSCKEGKTKPFNPFSLFEYSSLIQYQCSDCNEYGKILERKDLFFEFIFDNEIGVTKEKKNAKEEENTEEKKNVMEKKFILKDFQELVDLYFNRYSTLDDSDPYMCLSTKEHKIYKEGEKEKGYKATGVNIVSRITHFPDSLLVMINNESKVKIEEIEENIKIYKYSDINPLKLENHLINYTSLEKEYVYNLYAVIVFQASLTKEIKNTYIKNETNKWYKIEGKNSLKLATLPLRINLDECFILFYKKEKTSKVGKPKSERKKDEIKKKEMDEEKIEKKLFDDIVLKKSCSCIKFKDGIISLKADYRKNICETCLLNSKIETVLFIYTYIFKNKFKFIYFLLCQGCF